jgi:hypothetical protein
MGLEEEYNKQLREFRESLVEKARKQIEEEPVYEVDIKDEEVNHPKHYNKGKFETYDVIVDTLGKYEAISYCQGNILKYIMRMWNKDKPLQDAEKAEWYLKAMIKLLKETKGVNW